MVYTHNGILLILKIEWNNGIWSNMDGHRDCHTKWSKLDTERQIWYCLYVKYEKKIQVNLFPKQKETHENRTYDCQRGKGGVGEIRRWDWRIHTITL